MNGAAGEIYNILGIVGAVAIVGAYFANQQGWLASTNWKFPLANFLGAALILVSLIADWNLPSFVVEMFWLGISAYGLWRSLRSR